MDTRLVTLTVNEHGRPVAVEQQHKGRTSVFSATRSSYVIVTAIGTMLHGPFADEASANLCALHSGCVPNWGREAPTEATVCKVVPYWNVAGYGFVRALTDSERKPVAS